MAHGVMAFHQALSGLLPSGAAWPRDLASTQARVLRGVAGALAELDAVISDLVVQWYPHSTTTRLAEWEEATGLPDDCLGATQSAERRRLALLARLQGIQPAYEDSSPAAPGAIEAYCATLGYSAVVRYNTPFRCGRDRVGRRLGTLDGRLYVIVTTATTPLRVGVGRVGDRLIERTLTDASLECVLARIVPSRFEINVVFS